MNKKLVWLGIIVLGLVIFSEAHMVAAYYDVPPYYFWYASLGFQYPSHHIQISYHDIWVDAWESTNATFKCCQEASRSTYNSAGSSGTISSDTSFRSDFFKLYNNGFIGTAYNTGTISFSVGTGSTCAGDDLDGQSDTVGVFAYGYLYTLDALDTVTFGVCSYCSDNEKWNTREIFEFIDITGMRGEPSETDIRGAPVIAKCGGVEIDDRSGDYTTGGSGCCNNGANCIEDRICTLGTTSLPPGYYFVAVGLIGAMRSTVTRDGSTVGSTLKLARFNEEPLSAYDEDLYRLNGDPAYIITTKPISVANIKKVFGDPLVENTSWLCNLAGGQMLTEKYSTIFTLDILKGIVGFDMTKNCCGDDYLETYNFTYIVNSQDRTFYCNGGVWDGGQTAEMCNILVNKTGKAGDYVYEDLANIDKIPYYQLNKSGYVNGSDGCCGDDVPNGGVLGSQNVKYDYGYIDTSTNAYLCYADISGYTPPATWYSYNFPEPVTWNWKNAVSNSFKIYPFNINKTKTVDAVSNGKYWYYCNASLISDKRFTVGNPISDGKTLTGINEEGTISCATVMNVMFLSEGIQFTEDKDCAPKAANDDTYSCCGETTYDPSSFAVNVNDISSCFNVCWTGRDFVSNYPDNTCDQEDPLKKFFCPFIAFTDNSKPDSFPEKASCQYDLSGCLGDTFTQTQTCSILKGVICSQATQFCVNGKFVSSSDSTSCCYGFGERTNCVDRQDIDSVEECTALGGQEYSLQGFNCYGDHTPILGASNSECCFNVNGIVPVNGMFKGISLGAGASASQFLCYKDYMGNYFTQCIYDNSSVNLNGIKQLDVSDGRLRSIGASIHTISSFDSMNADGYVVDRVRKVRVQRQGTNTYASTLPGVVSVLSSKPFDLSTYDYLEFDIAYPTPTCRLQLTINYNSSGTIMTKALDLCKYLTQGDRRSRWNHVKINLTDDIKFSPNSIYKALDFRDPFWTDGYWLVIDSIRLTSKENNIYNTKDHYCTGGFGTWISDFDPMPNQLSDCLICNEECASDDPACADVCCSRSCAADDIECDVCAPECFEAGLLTYEQYGPYQLACEAQAAYDWTGQRCCGDDTGFNYGEYYSDIAKGCFYGSKINNNWTVAYINGILEDYTAFNDYKYRGIQYYNNSFVGCQLNPAVPPLSDLKVSNDGGQPTGIPLITKIVNDQCAVNGQYYCADGAWRKLVKISDNDDYIDFNENVDNGVIKPMELKTSPPGVELIKNGFRGN